MSRFTVGLDLGQAADPTALVVIERIVAEPCRYECRHLERFKLGTSYPKIVTMVSALLSTPPLSEQTPLVIDGTGVGRAVVNMFAGQLIPGMAELSLVPVTITSGDQVAFSDGFWRVPKRDLVGVIQALLQSDRLKFAAALPEVDVLVKELTGFQIKISEAGRDSYGCWREGQHDDLVLALSLALWHAMTTAAAAAQLEVTTSEPRDCYDIQSPLDAGYAGNQGWR